MSEVLWLNKETLEERWLHPYYGFVKTNIWVKVPDGATFATGDKDVFTFRKDGWYFDKQKFEWVEASATLATLHTYPFVNLFWVKCVVDNQTKDIFTLERLLGCEVLYMGDTYFVGAIYTICGVNFLILCNSENIAHVSNLHTLTFFTEDGDELTFDEYVNVYYGDGCEKHISGI